MNKRAIENDKNKMSVLFFGRKNCEYCKLATAFLRNWGISVDVVLCEKRGEKLPDHVGFWKGDYIISYRNYFILPKFLILRAEKYAINFHPGPPEYRGSGCINFALYNNEETYGVTAHLMDEKVDNGKILKVNRFAIAPNDDINSLLERTHIEMIKMYFDVITDIIKNEQNKINIMFNDNKTIKWSTEIKTIKNVDMMQKISLNASEVEIKRRKRAFHKENFPVYIKNYGYKFKLEEGE